MMLAIPWLRAHQPGARFVSKAVNHFWYGDTSPWTERRLEHSFDEMQSRPTAKVVILDRENPPKPRSGRTVESEE
jgi:predicted HD phosphohydrolase